MPARPKTYHGGLPKTDRLGRWRPVVGRTPDGKAARFQVGTRKTSEADALRRLEVIRDLYERQCADLGLDFWAGWVQCWAVKVAQGVPVTVHASSGALSNAGQAAEELGIVRQLQAWGVPIVVADDLPQLGYAALRQQIDQAVQRAVQAAVEELRSRWRGGIVEEAEQQTALPADPKTAPVGTLHGAMDYYKAYLNQTGVKDGQGNLSQQTRKCLTWLDMLKEHYADCQLWQMDIGAIQKMISYWRSRPPTKRGNRCSIDHAVKMVQETYRFLRWLDKQPKYRWTMPRGAEELKCTPIPLPEDDQHHQTAFRSTTKHTYTPEQLAMLAEHTDDFGRAFLGVCVNCAFGASEVGQWSTKEYHLFAQHPHAAALGMESTDADSWIVGKRPKTGIYGEHLLWEEVARAVQPFLDGREVLPVTARKLPWYRPHAKNAQSTFGNWWRSLVGRVQKAEPSFPWLPFGSLRDLLPNMLRREYSDEIASLALQHGKLSSDDLLDSYANLPYAKLFHATRELRTMFKPFLDALQTTSTSTSESHRRQVKHAAPSPFQGTPKPSPEPSNPREPRAHPAPSSWTPPSPS